MQFYAKPFHALTIIELYDLLKLRAEVFVVEQKCAFLDLDDKDQSSVHVLGYEGETLAAYSRLLPPGLSYPECSIGRVVTGRSFRSKGAGRALMVFSIQEIRRLFGSGTIVISAQCYLERFYSGFGFRSQGSTYLEDDIPHVRMVLE